MLYYPFQTPFERTGAAMYYYNSTKFSLAYGGTSHPSEGGGRTAVASYA